MKHPSKIEKYEGSLKALATDIGNLRYDALDEFLQLLSAKIQEDGHADLKRERKKLANRLYQAAQHLQLASEEVKIAWEISAPYMKDQ